MASGWMRQMYLILTYACPAPYRRRSEKDFWLMGEVIHGDYSRWVNGGTLAA